MRRFVACLILTTGSGLTPAPYLSLVAANDPPPPPPVHWGSGLTRNQVSAESNLPDQFDPETGLNVRWIAELGTEAHATPIAAGGRIFIGTNNQRPRDARHHGDRGVFQCFDDRDGRFLWQLMIPKYSTDIYQDWPRSGICSTATVEDNRVYILSNRGEALCLDVHGLANGNDGPFYDEAALQAPRDSKPLPLLPYEADVLWMFDIHEEVGTYPHDSAHSSFLLLGNHLYLNTGNGVDNTHLKVRRPDAPSLIVLDKRNGRLLARDGEDIGPRIFHSTWSSPAYGKVNGQGLIIFCGGDGVVYAFQPLSPGDSGQSVSTLKKVWWFDCDPTAPKENVHDFHQKTGKAHLSPSNIKSMPVIQNQRVYVTVGGDRWWGKDDTWLKCIDATGRGDITETGEIWSAPLTWHSMSSPAVHAGLVYAADCGRVLHCIDDATGEPVWTHEAEGEIWASPFVADGKVYLGTRRGDFWVLAAGRNKRVLSKTRLDSPISATATAASQTLYVATMKRLYAFGPPDSGR